MGAADDIRKGLARTWQLSQSSGRRRRSTASAGRWRMSRMREVRGKFLTEAADEVMEECYLEGVGQWPPARHRAADLLCRPAADRGTDRQAARLCIFQPDPAAQLR